MLLCLLLLFFAVVSAVVPLHAALKFDHDAVRAQYVDIARVGCRYCNPCCLLLLLMSSASIKSGFCSAVLVRSPDVQLLRIIILNCAKCPPTRIALQILLKRKARLARAN